MAARACACTARASSSESARSTPPVSIRSKVRPFHSHSSARRSRVTPGSASVTASRPPASRLTSVLFPTLGKPTTATAGRRRRARAGGSSGLLPAISGESLLAGDIRDLADDLVRGAIRGVDEMRLICLLERAVGALSVAPVAVLHRLLDRGDGFTGFGRPSPGANVFVCRQEHLERGLRADNRADIAALGDVVPPGDQLALPLHHGLPHLSVPGNPRRRQGHLRSEERRGGKE